MYLCPGLSKFLISFTAWTSFNALICCILLYPIEWIVVIHRPNQRDSNHSSTLRNDVEEDDDDDDIYSHSQLFWIFFIFKLKKKNKKQKNRLCVCNFFERKDNKTVKTKKNKNNRNIFIEKKIVPLPQETSTYKKKDSINKNRNMQQQYQQ